MAKFKQRCTRCKKNWIILVREMPFAVCYECQKKELSGEVKDPKMKKLFDIPEQLYMDNAFLRNIKSAYLRFGSLTDRQKEAFKQSVEKMKSRLPK